MTSTNFHILKEQQQKQINTLIQTVKNNFFPDEVKKQFSDLGTNLINAINAQRKFIYNELEEFEFNDEYNHTDEKNTNISTDSAGKDTRALSHSITQAINTIIQQNHAGVGNGITGPTNNKLSASVEEFKAFDTTTENEMKLMIDIILNSNDTEEPEKEDTLEEPKIEDEQILDDETKKSSIGIPAENEEPKEETKTPQEPKTKKNSKK